MLSAAPRFADAGAEDAARFFWAARQAANSGDGDASPCEAGAVVEPARTGGAFISPGVVHAVVGSGSSVLAPGAANAGSEPAASATTATAAVRP